MVETLMSERVYNTCKWATTIILPAIGTLYFALAEIWGLPAAQQVLGSIVALQAFFGVVLGISSRAYQQSDERFDGDLIITKDPKSEVRTFSLELRDDPDYQVQNKDELLFKVHK